MLEEEKKFTKIYKQNEYIHLKKNINEQNQTQIMI